MAAIKQVQFVRWHMPANLTPDYLAAERDYKSARTPAVKVSALERLLATLPKHKGTDKMQADIRRRLSEARKESQKKGASHAAPFYLVEKEGAAQVALVGPPNTGKSQLVCALTHARPEVADYPFTTRMPTPGMMNFENVQIQLVDLPPVSPEFTEPWLPQVIRNATASVLVIGPFDSGEYVLSTLKEPPILVVVNKSDLGEPAVTPAIRSVAVSALTGAGLDQFARAVFEELRLVRVYTKVPGKRAECEAPYVLHRGATVQDAARHVHKDFAERLKYARLFRRDGGHDGLMVERTHVIQDEDILEFHI
jgi:ribosome-interacting GTPase 1